jgi:hypothetical protein
MAQGDKLACGLAGGREVGVRGRELRVRGIEEATAGKLDLGVDVCALTRVAAVSGAGGSNGRFHISVINATVDSTRSLAYLFRSS